MQDRLKAAYTKQELEIAATIGHNSGTLAERIAELFDTLPDPLVSGPEIRELLGCSETQPEINKALDELTQADELEWSETTMRPLDTENLRLFRSKQGAFSRLRLLAIESDTGKNESRFQFTCDGRLLRSIAKVDRLDLVAGTGNQREEIRKHVERIALGIRNGMTPPTAVLLVLLGERTSVGDPSQEADLPPESFIVIRPLSPEWTEVPHPGSGVTPVQRFRYVEVDFPYRRAAFDEEKAAVLVDGQQRTAALSLVDIDDVPTVPLAVNATTANSEEAKKIFAVANSTQKIETQFSRALIGTMADAPGFMRGEQVRARAAQRLGMNDKNGPFFKSVAFPGAKTTPRPPIAYNSLFQIVSLFAETALPVEKDPDLLASVISRSFVIVKKHWPDAWGKKPTESRLMHGAGMRSMAALLAYKLESLYGQHKSLEAPEVWQELDASISRLQPHVIWTDAEMAEAGNAVRKTYREQISARQNTSQDIAALTTFLKKEMSHRDGEVVKKPPKAKGSA